MKTLIQKLKETNTGHAAAYLLVWGALLILTVITVTVSYFNFGDFNIFVAMLVATIKAALVTLFFMHLKYDNRLNQVVFVSAFFFLAVFILLTVSDELFRNALPEPVLVDSSAQVSDDPRPYERVTPTLLAKGKEVYMAQCMICHGTAGLGDGPASAAFNPKPRNFTANEWKKSGGLLGLYRTITEGLPGTPMPSFGGLSVEERMALSHYVRAFSKNPPGDRPEDIAFFKTPPASSATQSGPKIPVSFAIERMVKEASSHE